jgi:hypothetical protein
VQELVAQLQGPSRSRLALAPAPATADARRPERLGELRQQLATLDTGAVHVRAEFAATRAELVRKNLGPDILARHDQAAGEFEQRAQQFKQISAPSQSGEALVQALVTCPQSPYQSKFQKSEVCKIN